MFTVTMPRQEEPVTHLQQANVKHCCELYIQGYLVSFIHKGLPSGPAGVVGIPPLCGRETTVLELRLAWV